MEDKFYNDTNPGGKYLVTKQELLLKKKVANESVTSISMDKIFKFGKSKTYVLKLDIEGFGCKENHGINFLLIYLNYRHKIYVSIND